MREILFSVVVASAIAGAMISRAWIDRRRRQREARDRERAERIAREQDAHERELVAIRRRHQQRLRELGIDDLAQRRTGVPGTREVN